MNRDVDLYPHVRDYDKVWHQRAADDTGNGPYYPTRCGKTVRAFTVGEAVPDGPLLDSADLLCSPCYLET